MPVRSADTSRNVYVFGFTSFLNDTASEMAYWILPAFLVTIGAGPAQLGIIEGIAESVAAAAKLGSGYLADRLPRRKPLVIVGYAVANLAKPLLALANSWLQVLCIRFADRTAKGLRGAPRDVMLSESVPKEKLGAAFGTLQAMDSAGAIIGPGLAWLLVSGLHFQLRTVFWMAAVPGLLSIVIVSLFARETSKQHEVRIEAGDTDAHRDATRPLTAPPGEHTFSKAYWYTLFTVTLFSLAASSDMFLILRAQEVGINATYAPLLGLVFNGVYTAASWPAGRLSDKVPRAYVAAAGYFVYAITYFVFAKAPSAAAIWVTMGGYGLFYALTTPVLKALVVETVATRSRGRALGIYYFATSVAMLLASLVTGALWKLYGAQLPLYLASMLAVISGLLMLLNQRLWSARA
jgi:MFS family permease